MALRILGADSGTVKQTANVLNQAGAKYGVDPRILFGVWGMETSFGQNVSTSSAGAIGHFQFLPSTAAQYSYPLTNTPTMAQFTQQADGAAHYLADLFRRTGSWDAALKAYSGGGYGLSQVQDKAGVGPGTGLGGISVPGLSDVNPAGGIDPNVSVPNPLDIAAQLGRLADLVTSASFWVRIGEALLGLVALYLGFHALTGQSSSPGQQAKHIRTVFIPL